jgi:hypothetical protein
MGKGKKMNQNVSTQAKYHSFEEFRRAFYPEASKAEDAQRSEQSYGREMAKYAVERHFAVRDRKEVNK